MRDKKTQSMKERPILFSGEMVRAILDGRKTMTRRIMQPQPDSVRRSVFAKSGYETNHGYEIKCPYGQVGDRLWVRETWALLDVGDPEGEGAIYKAENWSKKLCYDSIKWKPPIFMPRWASRITLEITNIKVEQLQEISGKDAVREGCGKDIPVFELLHFGGYKKAKHEFCKLWNSINGKKCPWASNPWVWVIEFRRI